MSNLYEFEQLSETDNFKKLTFSDDEDEYDYYTGSETEFEEFAEE